MGSLTTVATLVILTLVPFLFIVGTSFVKISVVFSILRNALGTGQVPSSSIITALAVILSLYVMAPVGEDMVVAVTPFADRIDPDAPLRGESGTAAVEAFQAGKEPLVRFLERNSGERERDLFYQLAVDARDDDSSVSRDDLLVVLPAFLITELGEAFLIGFLVFIPFLVLELVISNVLLALGMHMMNPSTISLPFKLLLFVMVDGWFLLAEALITGYT
ncbi:MAG: type III secretion system export apparatus subunit SctR [Myxococcota bacterium]